MLTLVLYLFSCSPPIIVTGGSDVRGRDGDPAEGEEEAAEGGKQGRRALPRVAADRR
jgi:hypothetical protein